MADDEQITPPAMRPYGRHFLICGHGICGPAALAPQLEAAARDALGERRRLRNPERVKVSVVDCLGVCEGGPIGVVYPDGVWYHHLDADLVREIARSHLRDGQPFEPAVFHRLYPPDASPPYAPALRGDAGSYTEPQEAAAEPEEPHGEPPSAPLTQPEREERRRQARKKNLRKGLVILNTGDGKGKTTAALGLMTRAWGRKLRVQVIQFMKRGTANYGEVRAARQMGIPWRGAGDGWSWLSMDEEASAERARRGWSEAQQVMLAGETDVLVLDEFTYPLQYGWLDTAAVIAWLQAHKPPMLHVVITGRRAPQALIDFADLVTEMRSIKHPLDTQGIRAQPGIEF